MAGRKRRKSSEKVRLGFQVWKGSHERNVQVASEIPAERRTNVPKWKNPKAKENLDEEKSSRRSKEMPNYTGMESKRK
ncbi:hypothetical protein RUM44_010044 [Polyplax serrata]|uniref:Uncharacterized protein n=1 Tax=Polyplax serrata TaxID=468196 RepID=A0ABR1AUH0_POLSC